MDTAHFKGNYPDTCSLEGAVLRKNANVENAKIKWQPILPQVKLQADSLHYFTEQILSKEAFTHVRFNIFPDGGVSRLRLMGKCTP